MSWQQCAHKTLHDHATQSGERKIWCCSNCGWTSWWSDSWGYFGNLECKHCWTAQVDVVWCSEECAHQLATTRPELRAALAEERKL